MRRTTSIWKHGNTAAPRQAPQVSVHNALVASTVDAPRLDLSNNVTIEVQNGDDEETFSVLYHYLKSSDYFSQLIDEEWDADDPTFEFTLEDVPPSVFEIWLEWAYTKQICLEEDDGTALFGSQPSSNAKS